MNRYGRFALAAALMIFAVSVWSYRVHAAEEAPEFAPATTKPALIPAGTAIQAALLSKVASAAVVGDAVTVLTTTAVLVDGRVEILSGAQLKGIVQEITISDKTREVGVGFTVLLQNDRSVAIQARGTTVRAQVQSDFDMIRAGMRTLFGVALGAAIGAASGDVRLINRGVAEGPRAALALDTSVPITVILDEDINM